MKFSFTLPKKYLIKISLALGLVFILWVAWTHYQIINQSVLNPPTVEPASLNSRQEKIKTQLLDSIKKFHETKLKSAESTQPAQDPFASLNLDISSD